MILLSVMTSLLSLPRDTVKCNDVVTISVTVTFHPISPQSRHFYETFQDAEPIDCGAE